MSIDPLNFSNPTVSPAEVNVQAPVSGNTSAEPSTFGSAYRLSDAPKPTAQVMGVPFASSVAGEALASLPPIMPIGMAALTELSLQKMIQAPKGTPGA